MTGYVIVVYGKKKLLFDVSPTGKSIKLCKSSLWDGWEISIDTIGMAMLHMNLSTPLKQYITCSSSCNDRSHNPNMYQKLNTKIEVILLGKFYICGMNKLQVSRRVMKI